MRPGLREEVEEAIEHDRKLVNDLKERCRLAEHLGKWVARRYRHRIDGRIGTSQVQIGDFVPLDADEEDLLACLREAGWLPESRGTDKGQSQK